MKTSSVLRSMAGLAIIGAAVVAGYAVYAAQRTQSVVVATRTIPPFTKVSAADVTKIQIPVKAVQKDAILNPSQIVGHLTSMTILPDEQVRPQMISSSNSLQGLVNNITGTSNVTFPISYKQGSMDQYIQPDTYVDLVEQGQNGTTLHADHVLVLNNTGFDSVPNNQSNNQNQNMTLILTLPETTYLSMAQNLANSNVQVLMINQTASQQGDGQVQTAQAVQITPTTSNSSTAVQAATSQATQGLSNQKQAGTTVLQSLPSSKTK